MTYEILIGIITLIVALVAEIYSRKSYDSQKSPKLVIEAPYNNLLILRNVGTDIAKNIKASTDIFRDAPVELWNFSGPIDYMRTNSQSIFKQIDFYDEKLIQPSTSVTVIFKYENSDGNRFYSEIKIERGSPTQQVYFLTPILVNSGKI